jgi:hypothetical protein
VDGSEESSMQKDFLCQSLSNESVEEEKKIRQKGDEMPSIEHEVYHAAVYSVGGKKTGGFASQD